MANLRYLNTILTVLTLLVAMHLWTLWTIAPDFATEAHAAGIPDGGAQRHQIISQLKLLNQKTEQVKGVLQSGKMRVTITEKKQSTPKPKPPVQGTR
ncbi:MAG: hypothetical protein CMJ49_04425 [Planctomycetaceae bacterium]|nr:hypothetical protein [Planctomycetaceae bacterium]